MKLTSLLQLLDKLDSTAGKNDNLQQVCDVLAVYNIVRLALPNRTPKTMGSATQFISIHRLPVQLWYHG